MERVFHVISNTHWDREWRYPFQRNRQMLVDMIDKVLEILEKEPKYKAFHLDSQTIVLKDYLEIKPHKEDIIRKLINEKRLLVGPWYILPEEFQVGGENLIRNLLLGHKIAKKYGRVSKVGYSPFSWGQISQLPQIYAGFDINLIMFYRGINSLDSPKAEFLWIGADGTKAISSRFSTMPRYNFYFYIYRPVVHNEFFADIEHPYSRGLSFHFADEIMHDEDYFIPAPADEYFPENINKQVKAIIDNQVNDFTTPHVIWMEGHDSSGPNIKTVKIIEDIKNNNPELNVIHSTLEDYSDALLSSVDINSLKVVTGERRSSQYDLRSGNMYGYTTSARMYLKQMNFEAERRLQFYAEPFNVFSAILGRDIKDNYIDIAWELIIQNSAHDSIGGCSLDSIHNDMMLRYKNAIEISKGVFERALKFLVQKLDTSIFYNIDKVKNTQLYDVNIAIVNPTNCYRDEIVKVWLDIPKMYSLKSPKFIDIEGNIYNFIPVKQYPSQPVLEQMIDRPMYYEMNTYEGYLETKNIRPFSLQTLKLVDADFSNFEENIIKNNTLENEVLKVVINKNGTFNIKNKTNNVEFFNLGYFYDEGEEGHAWTNIPFEPFFNTLNSTPSIQIIENNAFSGKIKISHSLIIPKDYDNRKKNISDTELSIDLILHLLKNSDRLDLIINVDNKSESHRLRIMFPTNLQNAKFSYGEGQFDVVKRSLERPDTKNWVEQPMYDFPMHNFMDLNDENVGLAVLVDGLKEYEVLNDNEKTIAITLFRAFRYIIQPSSKQDYTHEKGSQCLGKSSYRLSLYPHEGNWDSSDVYNKAICYNNPVSLIQFGDTKAGAYSNISFMEIENKLIQFSTLKKCENVEDEFILRIYNPTENEVSTKIKFNFPLSKVTKVNLEENPIEDVELSNTNEFDVKIGYKKINTYKIKFK